MVQSDIIKKHDFAFSKKYGQNFIFDKNLLQAIVSDAGITKEDDVIEVGPGAGTLSSVIAEHARTLTCYEIDHNLKNILEESLGSYNNVQVIFEDILKVNLEELDKKYPNGYHVIANLPYYITTPIIFKFLEQSKAIKSMTIMVQKEVGLRMIAKPNTKDYGALTVSLNWRAKVEYKRTVKRQLFTPMPNVDSCIVRITFDNAKFAIDDENTLKRVIKAAFAMRRKTLANNLRQEFGLSLGECEALLTSIGLDPTIRGEKVSIEQFVEISNIISHNA